MIAWGESKGVVLGALCRHGHDHGGGSYRRGGRCIQCLREASKRYSLAWREKNPGAQREANRSYRKRNRERHRVMTKAWRDRHPGKAYEIAKRWNEKNPEKRAANNAARKASKIRATPKWADRHAMLEKYEESRRLTLETGVQYHVDHIVPLRHPLVCGLHVPANLQVIPGSVNVRKNNRFEVEV